MKKSLSFILALVMVLSVSTTAFAGIIKEDSTQQSDSTEIKYNVDPTYTVTIPSNVTLGEKATVNKWND